VASGIVESSSQGSQGQESSAQGGQRSKLVQRLLSASSNLPAFVNDLLTTQAVMVAGTEAAGFVLEKKEGGPGLRAIAHIRPDNSSAETRAAAIAAFTEIIKPCVTQGKDGAIEISSADNHPEPQFCLVTLLRADGEVVAVSAVITRCRNLERAQQRLMSMQLVAGYFELFTLRRTSEQSQIIAQSHQHVLQLATAVATAEGFESAAMNLCNELATRTGATRVSLGWQKGDYVRVKAFSHTEEFDKKQELVVELEKVMEECVDQEEPVQYDPTGEGTPNVTRAAQALSRSQGGNTVLSLPLRRRAEVVGVVTLEFPHGVKLGPQAATGLAVAVDLLAPQLFDRYQNDRWLITKAGLSTKSLLEKIIGPQYMLAKGIFLLVVGAILFISLYKPMYHVSAQFAFAPTAQTNISTPFDGDIQNVFVKPGDHVTKGQALLKFKTFELENKRAQAAAEAEQYRQDAEKARGEAKKDPTKYADELIASAKSRGAQAQVRLLDRQIDQATIKAPADGIILTGDLEHDVDAHKKQGEPLFTFEEGSGLRAELEVAERDIQWIKAGQTGQLATTSLPSAKYPLKVDRVDPIGQAKEGDNVFKVYAKLDEIRPDWKPGMEGEAKVDIEHRRLVWIWTHRLIDFLRLKIWM